MSKPTFDISSEAFLKYSWMISQLNRYPNGLIIDEDTDDEISFEVTKKASGKSKIVMKSEEIEITIEWDGTRLSAAQFDPETTDADKMAVPDAISEILDVLTDYLGIDYESKSKDDDNKNDTDDNEPTIVEGDDSETDDSDDEQSDEEVEDNLDDDPEPTQEDIDEYRQDDEE